MVECTAEMFSALAEDKQTESQTHRLCPDIEGFGDLLKVKGTYSNYYERTSFMI